MSELKITWTRSCIGRPGNQREIIRSLGLRRLHAHRRPSELPHHSAVWSKKVEHLVRVEEVEG